MDLRPEDLQIDEIYKNRSWGEVKIIGIRATHIPTGKMVEVVRENTSPHKLRYEAVEELRELVTPLEPSDVPEPRTERELLLCDLLVAKRTIERIDEELLCNCDKDSAIKIVRDICHNYLK